MCLLAKPKSVKPQQLDWSEFHVHLNLKHYTSGTSLVCMRFSKMLRAMYFTLYQIHMCAKLASFEFWVLSFEFWPQHMQPTNSCFFSQNFGITLLSMINICINQRAFCFSTLIYVQITIPYSSDDITMY